MRVNGEIMSDKRVKAVKKGHDFSKKNKVSVWASQQPYEGIPDEYFDETFSRNNTRATNVWSANFNLRFFNPENMETNGAHEGIVHIKKAIGECSFSSSYIDVLMSKARKKNLEEITWVVLLFEYEYSPKISGVDKDNYLIFLGAFDYDNGADNLYEAK
jgi:hypothetical protein